VADFVKSRSNDFNRWGKMSEPSVIANPCYNALSLSGFVAVFSRVLPTIVRDYRANSFKINILIFDILPYEFVSLDFPTRSIFEPKMDKFTTL
jgi:hypothetical protein